jgi:threonine/homoserine/homoserine lactone efflux protein
MKTAKLLFYAIVIFLAVLGGIAIFGIITGLMQYLFWIGAILLVGYVAVKALKKRPEAPQLEMSREERQLQDALRRLEEIKRAQLPK